jgi:hypothetical protein
MTNLGYDRSLVDPRQRPRSAYWLAQFSPMLDSEILLKSYFFTLVEKSFQN